MFKIIEEQGRAWLKEVDYRLATSFEEFKEYASVERCKKAKFVGADWEWNSQNPEKGKLVGFAISLEDKKGMYYPVAHLLGPELNLPKEPLIQHLKELDQHVDIRAIYHHYRSDSEVMLRNLGWSPDNWEDSMIAIYLENPNLKVYGLKDALNRWFQMESIEFDEVAKGATFDYTHPTDAVNYVCQDADGARRLFIQPSVQAALKEQEWIYNLEKQVLPELRTGEAWNKVYLDEQRLIELKADVDRRVGPLLAKIFELAGGEFRLESPAVLGPKLVELGVPITERTGKTQQVQTKKEILQKYAAYHPIVELVIAYKELTTQLRNYGDKMIGAVQHFGPLVRFPFHQVGVPTGRMKAGGEGSKDETYAKGVVPVNVQSLPDPEKKPYLPNFRAAIVANPPGEDDFVIIAVDYSQVELIVAGNMSREDTWIETFSKGQDIHLTNAKLAYRDYKMDKSDPRRKRGKTISFAILYGGDEHTVARNGGITPEQGKVLVDNFFAGAPKLKGWIEGWKKMARQQKFVKTAFGRKRPLDEYYYDKAPFWLKNKGDREAINSPIQGGAADIFKIGMVKLGKLIRANNWAQDCMQTLWIHDEFVLRVRRSMLNQIVPEVVKTLEFEVKGWPIKLKVDVEIGWNWGEMIPWSAYQVLGDRGLTMTPWKMYEKKFAEIGVGILNEETEEESEQYVDLDRASYGY